MGAEGCASCVARRATRAPKMEAGPAALAALCAGMILANIVAIVGGGIASEYVDAKFFSIVIPGLVGAGIGGCSIGAARLASQRAWLPDGMRAALRTLALGYGVASALYAFRFAGTSYGPVGHWLPPVVAGAFGAWLWTYPQPEHASGRRGRRGARSQRATRSS